MNTIKEKEQHRNIISIVLIICFYVTEDIMVFGTLKGAPFENFRLAIQIVVCAFLLVYMATQKIHFLVNDSVKLFLFLSAIIIFSMVLNTDFRLGYFFMIVIYFICILVLHVVSIERIMELLFKTMTFICAYSLVFYFLAIIAPGLIRQLPLITNIAGYQFRFAIFTNIPAFTDNMFRNFGPFREPGVFQMYIIISLSYGLFGQISQKNKLFSIIVHIIALITTFSTTGYISMLLLVIALLFDKNIASKALKRTIVVLVFIAIVYLATQTSLLFRVGYGSVFGKLFGTYESVSVIAREASVFANLKMLLMNPIVGKGITYVDTNFKEICHSMYGYASVDNTNTILIQFARFGAFFGAGYVFGFVSSLRKMFSLKGIANICFIASFFLLFVGENLSYSILISLFVFFRGSVMSDNKQIE